jgi:hypothetical protein
MLASRISYFARCMHTSAKALTANNIEKAFGYINTDPNNSIPSVACNIMDTLRLTEGTSKYLTGTFKHIADNIELLKSPIVLGSLQVLTNETGRLLTTTGYLEGRDAIFYPKSLERSLIPFVERYFKHNFVSSSLKSRLSNPNQLSVTLYEKTPVSTQYFGKYWHSEIIENTLDPKVVKFEEPMSNYVLVYRFRILRDLVRGSFVTYPPSLAYFNEQLRIIELMFSKTALSAEESQKLLRGALNAVLYGCEDYAHVEETIELVQKDKGKVSKGLKRIIKDIELHGKKHGFAFPQTFVPNSEYFVIHTSFRDKVLNNVSSDCGQGV